MTYTIWNKCHKVWQYMGIEKNEAKNAKNWNVNFSYVFLGKFLCKVHFYPFLSENYSRFLAQSEQSLPSRSWCNMLATTPRGRKVNFEEVKEFLIKLKVKSVKSEEGGEFSPSHLYHLFRARRSTERILFQIFYTRLYGFTWPKKKESRCGHRRRWGDRVS